MREYHVKAGVDASIHREGVVGARRVGDLVDAHVVGNDEALESQLMLQHTGEQETVGVHFDAIPAAVRGHDGGHALADGVDVRLHVDVHQLTVAHLGVVAIDAVGCASVAYEVLRARRHLVTASP